jgi:hypothetical protein
MSQSEESFVGIGAYGTQFAKWDDQASAVSGKNRQAARSRVGSHGGMRTLTVIITKKMRKNQSKFPQATRCTQGLGVTVIATLISAND